MQAEPILVGVVVLLELALVGRWVAARAGRAREPRP